MRIPANKTPQVELLERDVYILLQEVQRLRQENEELRRELKHDLNQK
jgi:cell division septum initiation protein DivIVA